MGRKEILESAIQTVCKDRQDKYGNCEDNFGIIAELWSGYLDAEVRPEDVAVMMMLLKIARIRTGVYDPDNYIDIAGYAACGSEIASKKQIIQMEPLAVKADSEAAVSATAPATPDPQKEIKAGRAKKDLDEGEMRALREAGWSLEKIADEMNCSPQTVANRLDKYKIAPAT